MSKLDIKIYPDPVLKKKASKVERIGGSERKLAYDMIETMRSADGVGLAAPQVGVDKRIIAVQDIENNRSSQVFINPKILKRQGRSRFCEGCLSVPGLTSDVIRPERITLEAFDLDGKLLKIDAAGFLARVIQHEIDHLDGILFIDRIGFFKRKKMLIQISPTVCARL